MRLVHDDDDWDEEDVDEPDDEMVPCPHCRRPVYEDAERCPACGQYLTGEDAPRRRPLWLILGVGACLVIVYRWIFFI